MTNFRTDITIPWVEDKGPQRTVPYEHFNEVLDALQQLMNYVGGWEEKGDHPCGKATRVLRKYTGK